MEEGEVEGDVEWVEGSLESDLETRNQDKEIKDQGSET